MASKAVPPAQSRGGDAKNKNGVAEGRNRIALGDIGNVVNPPANISRPITRRFCAQLIANAQAEAEKNKLPVEEEAVADEEVDKEDRPEASERSGNEEEEYDGIIKSLDRKEMKKKLENSNGRTKSVPHKMHKNKVKSLTSILTARSKAASGLASIPDAIVDIDANDSTDELFAVEYVEDIYKFYKETEEESMVPDYMHSQSEINSHMRSILVDWLIDVHNKFELMPETLYLAVNIVDRYLAAHMPRRRELQLVGIGSMLIACKYEEIWAPEVNDFLCISDSTYFREQILVMEKNILGKLEWCLTVPTPYVFLLRYIKASVPSDKEEENMAYLLSELGLLHYPVIVGYSPSKMAACAVYAARLMLDRRPFWTSTLRHYTGYREEHVIDGARLLVGYHKRIGEGKLRASYRKFFKAEKGGVALLPPAKSPLTRPG